MSFQQNPALLKWVDGFAAGLQRPCHQRGVHPGGHQRWHPGSGGMTRELAAEGEAGQEGPARNAMIVLAASQMHLGRPLLAVMTFGDCRSVEEVCQGQQLAGRPFLSGNPLHRSIFFLRPCNASAIIFLQAHFALRGDVHPSCTYLAALKKNSR